MCQEGGVRGHRVSQRVLIDDLKTRMANGATYQQLGFTTEEQVRLFILLSKETLMDPHPDRWD